MAPYFTNRRDFRRSVLFYVLAEHRITRDRAAQLYTYTHLLEGGDWLAGWAGGIGFLGSRAHTM